MEDRKGALTNEKALAQLVNLACPANTGSTISLQLETPREEKKFCGTARFCSEEVHKYTYVRPKHRV